ncbi:MAG: ATP-dependent helicase [Candidatus Limnocylindria bacterium]
MTVVVTSPAIDAILASLDPEQRAAATLPDGPAQIIAPAGSGKTTTLVARLGVLLSRGTAPDRICVVTFNRDAAVDLAARVDRRLGAAPIEIRTLHALARQVLLTAGEGRDIVADRLPLLRAAHRRIAAATGAPPPDPAWLDTLLSAWKVEAREPPPEALPALAAYAELMRGRGAVDFDDLVVRAAELLEAEPRVRLAWQSRFSHVCVDEFQDVDAAQLRLVRLLAAPEDNLFVVGDDDQTIYAWRLADVRRILRFGDDYPSAQRVMLATNYRCPAGVIEASARMVAVNRERFEKPIRPPPGATASDDDVVAVSTADPGWTDALAAFAAREAAGERTVCFLSRTRAELMPVLLALVRGGIRHATAVPLPVDSERVDSLVEELRAAPQQRPFAALHRIRAARGWSRGEACADELSEEDLSALDALLGWSVAFDDTRQFVNELEAARERIRALRDPSADIELATVHGSKGREWETVVLIGFEAERIPNRRSLVDALDPDRAMEEERRLAYVALTRATRQLILAFDPARPSPFLAEMGYAARL